jgi:hypothetical protein
MRSGLLLASFALLVTPPGVLAQHTGGGASRAVSAPREATQFDFLIGQWDLAVHPKATTLAAKIHGVPKLVGSWKAWRAFDGWGIDDEMRIMDASGNSISLASAMRFYDATARQWVTTLLDVYRGKFSTSTATWSGTEMTVMSRGTDQEGKPVVMRTRFFDITPVAFRYQQDRSVDEGKSWEERTLVIEAKRVAGAGAALRP